MIKAFYTATNGAMSNQHYFSVISNNMANIQTDGYKKSKAEFSDLLYTNIRGAEGENTNLKAGSGSRLQKIDILFNQGELYFTNNNTDFAIQGDGFFQVLYGEDTFFTRGGNFELVNMDDENYLMYQGGYVLDENEEIIIVENKDEEINVGVFAFENNANLQRASNNLFKIENEDIEYNLVENKKLLKGYLETSGVGISDEMLKMMQIQKSFQLNSKVIQTADEIEQIINSLKG